MRFRYVFGVETLHHACVRKVRVRCKGFLKVTALPPPPPLRRRHITAKLKLPTVTRGSSLSSSRAFAVRLCRSPSADPGCRGGTCLTLSSRGLCCLTVCPHVVCVCVRQTSAPSRPSPGRKRFAARSLSSPGGSGLRASDGWLSLWKTSWMFYMR